MFGKKGQGTTEYLIILSVIIVIALVVVGVMGWFPGLGTTITEQQSRAYWAAASPVAITAWSVDATDTQLVLRNLTTDEITITNITLSTGGGAATSIQTPSFTNVVLTAGSQATKTGTGVTCPTLGNPYSYNVIITYNVTGGLQAATQRGSKPMIGTCG